MDSFLPTLISIHRGRRSIEKKGSWLNHHHPAPHLCTLEGRTKTVLVSHSQTRSLHSHTPTDNVLFRHIPDRKESDEGDEAWTENQDAPVITAPACLHPASLHGPTAWGFQFPSPSKDNNGSAIVEIEVVKYEHCIFGQVRNVGGEDIFMDADIWDGVLFYSCQIAPIRMSAHAVALLSPSPTTSTTAVLVARRSAVSTPARR